MTNYVQTGCPDALDIDKIVAGAAGILNISGSSLVSASTASLDQDHINALNDLESYRKIRMGGPGGNFQGFVDAIIGSDRDLPGIKQQLIVYQSQTPIDATIGGLPTTNPGSPISSQSGIILSNSILGIAWNWLKGKKTYIISGLIIGWSQLNAMRYIDQSTYQTGLSILGALGLAAIRMGMSNN